MRQLESGEVRDGETEFRWNGEEERGKSRGAMMATTRYHISEEGRRLLARRELAALNLRAKRKCPKPIIVSGTDQKVQKVEVKFKE